MSIRKDGNYIPYKKIRNKLNVKTVSFEVSDSILSIFLENTFTLTDAKLFIRILTYNNSSDLKKIFINSCWNVDHDDQILL